MSESLTIIIANQPLSLFAVAEANKKMPINFRSVSKAPSVADSLRAKPLLSPPLSHNSSEDIPFKADNADRISLSMKKSKGHMHGWHHSFPRRAPTTPIESSFKRRRQDCKDEHTHISSGPRLRSTRSLPTMLPRNAGGNRQPAYKSGQRKRRWSVASKAASTRGLATVIPVAETANKRRKKRTQAIQSPAMITLRRATTSRPPERMSLTSFPPPKFGRDTGFLSSFLNSITGHGDYRLEPNPTLQSSGDRSESSPSYSCSKETWPSTSSIAPPMFTELTSVEPHLSLPHQIQAIDRVRRCSTRYISDDGVHEIIWDENSSSASSESLNATPGDRQPELDEHLSDTEILQRRLSEVLVQSRRGSASTEMNRRTSYWPGSENISQALLPLINNSPKLAKIAREAAFRTLPRSKAWRQAESVTPLAASMNLEQQHLLVSVTEEAADVDVQYFPPLAGLPNSRTRCGSASSDDEAASMAEDAGSPFSGSPGGLSAETRARDRLGSMVGISRHQKRLSYSTDALPAIRGYETHSVPERAKSSASGRMSGDDTVPLLRTR